MYCHFPWSFSVGNERLRCILRNSFSGAPLRGIRMSTSRHEKRQISFKMISTGSMERGVEDDVHSEKEVADHVRAINQFPNGRSARSLVLIAPELRTMI